MGINLDQLLSSPMPLKGFTCDIVQPMRAITLSVLAGKSPRTSATMVDFLGVKAPSSYNAILGRPTLNNLRVVTSTYHLKMKLSTDLGVGEVRGGQVLARKCYAQELRHEIKDVKMIGEAKEAARPPSLSTLAEWDEKIRDEQAL
ncbi:uncharacterized protein LOC121252386 [Juglans microcarpa x Juglans regia]|uniref:uncharacterized protein LOC121252386 n=1 Tax=Juglans microcarpa x Juglans regia TaxID=2249226 RepID=UPI001B7F1E30|nr:uncharacterized protein LOC121252386 [Juglans microcarpa x Juglans regia]